MKHVRIKDYDVIEYQSDVDAIVSAMAREGYDVSETEAQKLWELYSEASAAQWLFLPEDQDDIVYCLQPYFEEVEEDE